MVKVKTSEFEIILQCRMGSSRLPGKILLPFFQEKHILQIQYDHLKKLGIPIKVATTINTKDDVIVQFCRKNGIEVYRGDENDVLKRFYQVAKSKYLIRVCSDNPFLFSTGVEKIVSETDEKSDYVSFQNNEGLPAIKTHWGLFAEVTSFNALEKAYFETNSIANSGFREHVTSYIYENPDEFDIKLLDAPKIIKNRDDLRYTVDTQADFENMQRLYHILNEKKVDFSLSNLIETTDEHPEIKQVMSEGIANFSK